MDHPTSSPRPAGAGFDIGAFVRAAAHDMAGQINAISMNGELVKLLLERKDLARAEEIVERMLGDCGRYGRMVRALERFGAGMTVRQRRTAKVADLIETATTTYVQEFAGAKPTLHVDADDSAVVVDEAGMQRVLAGLLQNAAEAGAASISVTARRDGSCVDIVIADDGSGIAPNIRARIADPFFTTRRDEGHNGLGLTLATALADAHGGTLSIEENEGHGTRAAMRLPLAG